MTAEVNQQHERVMLGRITGVYGVKGWVKVISHTDPPSNILQYPCWQLFIEGQWETVDITRCRPHGKGFVVHIAGCDDRDLAQRYVNTDIAVDRVALPALPPDEYYWQDLIGLQVVTVTGAVLGQVSRLMETGANDVLVVQGERECLIPYLPDQVIKKIDLAEQQIVVDWDPEY